MSEETLLAAVAVNHLSDSAKLIKEEAHQPRLRRQGGLMVGMLVSRYEFIDVLTSPSIAHVTWSQPIGVLGGSVASPHKRQMEGKAEKERARERERERERDGERERETEKEREGE